MDYKLSNLPTTITNYVQNKIQSSQQYVIPIVTGLMLSSCVFTNNDFSGTNRNLEKDCDSIKKTTRVDKSKTKKKQEAVQRTSIDNKLDDVQTKEESINWDYGNIGSENLYECEKKE